MACTACAEPGVFWDGEPRGKIVKANGLDAYFSESKDSKRAVLLITDIHSWEAKNVRLLADKFANDGLSALVPDFFKEPCPTKELREGNLELFMEWRKKHGPEVVVPDAEKAIQFLRENGAEKVGVIGFCWGARFGLILGEGDQVDAVVMNHGSFVTEDLIQKNKKPLLVNASDNDQQIPIEKLEIFRGILAEKAESVPSDVKFFPGANHGWTCRGDAGDPKLAPQIVDAHNRASNWFQKYL